MAGAAAGGGGRRRRGTRTKGEVVEVTNDEDDEIREAAESGDDEEDEEDDEEEDDHRGQAYATAAAGVTRRRQSRQRAVALGTWGGVSRDRGSRGLFARIRGALTKNRARYTAADGALEYHAHVSLAKAWALWCGAVHRSRDAGVLMQRAIRHFRHGASARAFYTWMYCFEWAQKSHRKLLQAVAIGNRARISRAWRCWRTKASDLGKARRHLLAKSRELELTHEHHLRAIHDQRVAMQHAAATNGNVFEEQIFGAPVGARAAGAPAPERPAWSVDRLGASLADRETSMLMHQITSVKAAPADRPAGGGGRAAGPGAGVSSSLVEYSELTPGGLLEGAETVAAYCRARITCHVCHNMMHAGELFVCLRHGMPTHLQCFQHVMKTSTRRPAPGRPERRGAILPLDADGNARRRAHADARPSRQACCTSSSRCPSRTSTSSPRSSSLCDTCTSTTRSTCSRASRYGVEPPAAAAAGVEEGGALTAPRAPPPPPPQRYIRVIHTSLPELQRLNAAEDGG